MGRRATKRALKALPVAAAAAACLLASPATSFGAATVETFDDHVELKGGSADNAFLLTKSLSGHVLVSAQSGQIEILDAGTTRSTSCYWPRRPSSGVLQHDKVVCPTRPLITVAAGEGDDTVWIDKSLPATAKVDGQGGRDQIFGRNNPDDTCRGGLEDPPVDDTIEYCPQPLTVNWEEIDSPLGRNYNAGGGRTMFPDAVSGYDSVNRRLVRVIARAPAEYAGRSVYFKSFDVDDPSSDPIIDPNGPDGFDNRKLNPSDPSAGRLSQATAVVGPDGTASTVLDVTPAMQPGDNFVVAASFDQAALANTPMVSLTQKYDDIALTEMLTIWRRLNIELDTMVAPPAGANSVSGMIVSSQLRPDGSQVCDVTAGTDLGETNQYQHGKLTVGGVTYNVISNFASTLVVRAAGGNGCPSSSAGYSLRDDDVDSILPMLPDTRLIQNSDLVTENAFADAYIRPVVVPEGHDGIPFERNTDTNGLKSASSPMYRKRDIFLNSNYYWVAYLISAFQGPANADSDPDYTGLGGSPIAGITPAIGAVPFTDRSQAIIFQEVVRDWCPAVIGVTEAHELGHVMGARDGEGKIMTGECAANSRFSSASVARMRGTLRPGYWPGE